MVEHSHLLHQGLCNLPDCVEDSLRHRLMPWRRPKPQRENEELGVSVTAGDTTPEPGTDAPTSRPDDEPWV